MDAPLKVTREEVIAGLGGEAAVKRMDHDARADALEEFLSGRLDAIVAARGKEFPAGAGLADKVDSRRLRRRTRKVFMHGRNLQDPDPGNPRKVGRAAAMAEKATLIDFFKLRFP